MKKAIVRIASIIFSRSAAHKVDVDRAKSDHPRAYRDSTPQFPNFSSGGGAPLGIRALEAFTIVDSLLRVFVPREIAEASPRHQLTIG